MDGLERLFSMEKSLTFVRKTSMEEESPPSFDVLHILILVPELLLLTATTSLLLATAPSSPFAKSI